MDGSDLGKEPAGMGVVEYRMQYEGRMVAAIHKLRLALIRLKSIEQFLEIADDGETVEAWEFDMLDPVFDPMFAQGFLHSVDAHAEAESVKAEAGYKSITLFISPILSAFALKIQTGPD